MYRLKAVFNPEHPDYKTQVAAALYNPEDEIEEVCIILSTFERLEGARKYIEEFLGYMEKRPSRYSRLVIEPDEEPDEDIDWGDL